MAIANWQKIDIHTHTPASDCMHSGEKDITARDWINAAKEKIDAVVVTDHNSIEWVDKLQAELKKEDNLFIYNGVELSVGDKGNHIIVIFDPGLEINFIDAILSQMGLMPDKRGRTDICISLDKFINTVKEYRERLLIIPAHFFSNNGLGNLANHSWVSNYYAEVKFDAIEIKKDEEIETLKNKIAGLDINDFRVEIEGLKNIATVIGSDNPYIDDNSNHSIQGIGNNYTWFKLSEFTLEALRQSFLDPDSRIKKVFNSNTEEDMNVYKHSYISGIRINELEHLKKIDLRFSPNLNCIVGGRGTGKSTIVEMIKKVIYTNNNIDYEEHHLLKSLKDDSEINLFYNFGTFAENDHLLKYTKDSVSVLKKDSNINDLTEANEIEFPLDIYSQKEIYEMVDEEINPVKIAKSKFLEIIDGNIEFKLINLREEKNREISKITKSYSKILTYKDNLKDLPKLASEKTSLETKLKLIEDCDLMDIINKKTILNSIDETMDDFNELYCNVFNQMITELNDKNEKYKIKIVELEEKLSIFDENLDVVKYLKVYLDIAETLKENISNELSKLVSIKEEYDVNELLLKKKGSLDKEYRVIIEKLDINDGKTDVEEISKMSEKLNEVNDKIDDLKTLNEEVEKENNTIKESIEKLIIVMIEIYNIRNKIVNEINEKSEIIEVELSLMGDKERWINKLRNILGREMSFDSDFETLGELMFNDDILENIKKWLHFIYLDSDRNIKEFLNIEKLQHIGFKKIWESIDGELYNSFIDIIPDDKVFITIKKNVNNIKINDGSPGEKAAAVLSFIMNQGEGPLIIDQPEDDLDNSLIIDLIVNTIRDIKKKRQIIIVTHNPNIPVLGDAEAIIILERDEDGYVNLRKGKKAGCIEEKTIKDGICSIMEGGLESFKKRDKKYKI